MNMHIQRYGFYSAVASLALYVTNVMIDTNCSFATAGFVIAFHVAAKFAPAVRHRFSTLAVVQPSIR